MTRRCARRAARRCRRDAAFTFSLEYEEWYSIESCCDAGYTEISTNGGATWSTLTSVTGSTGWRTQSLSLPSVDPGDSLLLRFRFTSDGSVVNPGWYIDNLRITATEVDPIDVNFVTLDAQDFPIVRIQARINDIGGNCPTPLNETNFRVYEDGVEQTGLVVTPPGAIQLADVVFSINNSGSMSDEQAAVIANIEDFVDALDNAGIDAGLGLVRYGQSLNNGNPIAEDSGSLTTDVDYFKDDVLARNLIDGGTEPGYWAIVVSSSNFSWRPGSQRVLVQITDETPNQGGATLQNAVDAIDAVDGTLFAVVSTPLFVYYTSLVEDTESQLIPITDPFDEVFDFIVNSVSGTYGLRYTTTNAVPDGTQREVVVEMVCGTDSGSDTDSYTPSEAPNIVRTQTTISLSGSAQVDGQPVTISAEIDDGQSPFVQTATLFYRNLSNVGFQSTAMSLTSGTNQDGLWTAQIPAGAVQDPGIEYYISASDGVFTSSDPGVTPAANPYQIAVLPNLPPTLNHSPVATAPVGTAINIVASASDTTNALAATTLYYREGGTVLYTQASMAYIGGIDYQASIPAGAVGVNGIDYYIQATDNFGISTTYGSADVPIFISVEDGTPDVQVLPITLLATLKSAQQYTKLFQVGNAGDGTLTISDLYESTDFCATMSDVSWLSLSGGIGSYGAGDTDQIAATFDSRGLLAGNYQGALCVVSNDPDEPTLLVPLSMEALASDYCAVADFNGDGNTNSGDIAILFQHWGQTVTPNTNGDMDGNGVVNGSDFSLLAGCINP